MGKIKQQNNQIKIKQNPQNKAEINKKITTIHKKIKQNKKNPQKTSLGLIKKNIVADCFYPEKINTQN